VRSRKDTAGLGNLLTGSSSRMSPKAFVGVIANPVNSTVPIFAETYKLKGVYDPKRLFGVTTLDCVRAATFVSEIKGTDPTTLDVNVVGGHSGATIVPLLSQTGLSFTKEELEKLTFRIQFGGDEVVKAKDGTGSATLSMAMAAERWVYIPFRILLFCNLTYCVFLVSPTRSSRPLSAVKRPPSAPTSSRPPRKVSRSSLPVSNSDLRAPRRSTLLARCPTTRRSSCPSVSPSSRPTSRRVLLLSRSRWV